MYHGHKTKEISNADEESRRTQVLADYRATFSSDHGERVLGYLRAAVRYDSPSFLPRAGGYDPIAAAIRDGRKSVIAEILEHLATPEDGRTERPKVIK